MLAWCIGLSRTPDPRALQRLAAEGIVELRPAWRACLVEINQSGTGRGCRLAKCIAAIEAFIRSWNDRREPFVWIKTANEILAKAEPHQKTSYTRH